METKTFRAQIALKDGEKGTVQALFSVFDTIDQSKDVVLPSFFKDGQAIPMAAWGHDWGSLPPGRGVVKVTPRGAVFDGRFFMNTPQGQAHYETIKEMHDLQEWSFGFRIVKSERGKFRGEPVRFLQEGEIFEASPVLIGDNRETRTLFIKRHARLSPAEVAELEAIRRAHTGDGGMDFEIERARALGVDVKRPSRYARLTLRQQMQVEAIRARALGVRV